MKHVYVASPYSHEDKGVMYERAEAAMRFVADWYNTKPNEWVLISPIAYMAPAERAYGLPGNWEFWSKIDMSIIERSDEMWILMLDGAENSIGVRAEVKFAQEIGKPIKLVYLTEDSPTIRPLTEAATMNYSWDWHGN